MSFSEDYWNQRKKKKKEKSTGDSFSDEYYSLREEKEEDIAPVLTPTKETTKKTTKNDDSGWFKASSAFDDGYDFGDVTKSILGTTTDLREHLVSGILGIGEKAVDAGAYLVGGVGGLFGADDFKENVGEFIEKDIIDEEAIAKAIVTNPQKKFYGVDTEDSVFGEKTDSLVESGGQLLGTIGLQAVGVPWFVTSGVTSFGAEAESALGEGASFEEAGLSAAISAGAEILTEKLFGGSGLGEQGLINLEPLTRGISSKFVKALADYGLDIAAEGSEEVVAELAGNLASALYKEESLEELLFSEEAVDGYIDSFIGGAVLGGVMNVGNLGHSVKTGEDYRTGLTTNEQKVFDKVYEDLIAQEEKNGKVTSKRKSEIYDEVREKMEKGYISTDTIEEVLGGETYNAYKDTVAYEDSLFKEYEELGNKQNATLAEQARYAELSRKVEDIKANSRRNEFKTKLSNEVLDMVKGDRKGDGSRLLESYNEDARRYEDFRADFDLFKGTKHEDAARKTLESAIKAGANNTNRVHDLVDMAAKTSADTGLTFEFKSGEQIKEDFITRQKSAIAELESLVNPTKAQTDKLAKLKETLAKVESGEVVVNGDISGGNIVLNLDSHKPLNRVVGHEVTHSFEPKKGKTSKEYTALRDSLFAYAKSKGIDIDSELENRRLQYEGITDASPEAELVADLVGDFLFTDSEYINKLSVENRNVFQKIWDEIKHLCKLATAGSQEARELERVRKAFEDAYRAEKIVEEIDADVDDVQYSVSVKDENTLDFLNEQLSRGEYDAETNPDGGYYVTYKSMSFWGYDEHGNAILRSPMAEYVDGKLSNAYLIPKDKGKLNWYEATETIDEKTGLPTGLMVKVKKPGNKSYSYVPAAENQHLIAEDWSNLYFNLKKKVLKKGKWEDSNVPARYNPYEHSSNSMLNDQFSSAYLRDNLVTVKMYVPVSEDNGTYRAQWSKDATGWADWKTGTVAGKINQQKDLQRRVYLSRYAAPVEIVPDSEVAQAYKEYLDGTDVSIPDNVVSPGLLSELKKAGVPITESGLVKYSLSDSDGKKLTKEQQEYFKDSKARDNNGNLLKVYHTTKNDFTVFDHARKGEATEDANTYLGFFFTDDAEYMQNFPEFQNGKTDAYYLDIKNPIDMTNISKEAFLDIVEVMGGDAQEAAEVYDEELAAEQQRARNRGDNYTALSLSSLLDALTGEYYYEDFYNELQPHYDELMSKGYDGIVNYMDELFGVREYIVLNSNQAKLATNENPTSDADIRYSMSSIANSFFGDENMSAKDFAKKDYRQTQGYKDYVEQCVNNYRQTKVDFADRESEYRKEIEDSIDGIVKVAIAAKQAGYDIYDDATKRSKKDSKNRLLFSSLEPNSDYFTSNDISTICDKRKNFAEIYDDIVKAEEKKGVPVGKRFFDNVDNYFYLHKLMADKGLTQPCRQCYVESMRKNLAPMASAFLRLVKETDPNNTANDQLYQQKGKNKGSLKTNNASTREWVLSVLPEYDMSVNDLTVETLTTEDGLAQLKIQAPMVYEAFNSFYGQSKPKMPKSATPFRFGELTALLTDHNGKINQKLVKRINDTGGFRLQSYSDFQIQNYTDVLQVLFEAGTLGLNGHAYTKVPAFLDATEGTNLKRNISIFMYKDGNEWKLDKNDSFPMSLDEIYEIVKADKSGNTGIIAVSQNADMSAWIMANDYVGYGIPFHKSGLKMGTVRDTIVKEDGREIKGYSGTKDHTKQQTEVWAKASEDHKALTKVKKGINIYSFWDFNNEENLSKKKLIEKNVKAYINACDEAGYLPKFREYVMNNGKVLNDVLEYSKKLGFASQDATIEDISFQYKGYTIPYGYYKFLGDFGMFTPDGNASPQEALSLKNYDFDKAVKFFSNAETLRRNEILQQFSNGVEREKYRNSNLTAEELQEIVKRKRGEIAKGVVGDLAPAMSLSDADEDFAPIGNFDVYGKDFRKEDIAPTVSEMVGENAPMTDAEMQQNLQSLGDEDVPPEVEEPYYEEEAPVAPRDPFEERDFKGVGKRDVNAYMHDNPEVKPYFQMQAKAMLGDLQNSVKGERWYNNDVYYESGGEYGWSGTERQTTDDIAYLLDMGYTYAQIEKGLNAIIEDNGAENIAMAKRIEFALNDRLSKGYTDINGVEIPPNEGYLNLLAQKQTAEAIESQIPPHTDADAPMEDIAPVKETKEQPKTEPKVAQVKVNEEVNTKKTFGQKVREAWDSTKNTINTAVSTFGDKGWVFENLSKKTGNRELEAKYNFLHYSESRAQEYIKDNLMPIVERVKQTGKTKDVFNYVYHLHNIDRMSLESDENRIKRESLRKNFKGLTDKQIEAIAMEWIRKDTPKDVRQRIKQARDYIDANKGKNKPVFGDSVTADVSREAVKKYEAMNPEFKELEKAIVEYNRQLRKMLVDGNVISQKTADMWEKMYPHYVPIRREGKDGLGVTVPLDTNKTGVNAPIQRATGGDSRIEDLFETMVIRTEQTFKAIAKNSFGVELMHTLDTDAAKEQTTLDQILDSFDSHEDLLQEGKRGKSPTFTVFEDGKRVTFEITQDMYDALKPTSEKLAKTYKIPNAISNIHRGLLTDKNPVFLLTNAIKDAQDVLINSQHAGKTYRTIPRAIKELASHGSWFREYIANGGEQNTYFDSEAKTFKGEDQGVKKWLNKISEANNFIERIPRLAEYIASREEGRSIEVSMLDAARVTTNFAAGADVTKFLNRNGSTFLNASVQGAMQQVRNVREANANGVRGWAMLAGKVVGVGLAHTLLNHLLWDDDEDYEELSDYVKQNYYIVAKTEDGRFIRIPKGRTLAVIQEAFTQMENLVTGDDNVDLANFAELVISNLAPNNPLDNSIFAPAIQAMTNTAWYGGDIVPTRLQDLPSAEQYDESTDVFSRWLGEQTNWSPYKINYLLNQYSGGIGDVFLPMMTPEAESGDNSLLGNFVAPLKDKFSTDPVMNNQNVSDFYTTMDELTKNAKSSKATDEDVLKYKYFNSVNAELSELYKQKREIQNSDLSDEEKYAQAYEIQQQIVELTRESLDTYNNVNIIDCTYAVVGDRHYRLNDKGEWQKLTDKQLETQQAVTEELGISATDYWRNKSEYEFAYEYPEKYAVAKSMGGYDAYRTYASELYDIHADKDEYGKSINGSRKEKVIEYINNLDADYGEKIILFKSEYPADDTYNYDIIDYLNGREDISYEEMEDILKELGFNVSSDGTITWD